MHELLNSALREAWQTFSSDLNKVPLYLWDEFTFRFFLVRAILEKDSSLDCESEWKRHDLLLVRGNEAAIVELKFNVKRFSLADVRGRQRAKGGAGTLNYREFCDCVRKLGRRATNPELASHGLHIVGCFLVLVYGDALIRPGSNTYSDFYDRVSLPSDLCEHLELQQHLVLDGVECPSTSTKLQCKLFEVSPRKVL